MQKNDYILKKLIVISGANLYYGGALSIIQDCLEYLDTSLTNQYKIIALVHDVKDFSHLKNIELKEFPDIRKSYLHHIYYEYFKYNKLSKKLNPYLWVSINDFSSNIVAEKRAVYCHNLSPFRKITPSDLYDSPRLFLSSLIYKKFLKINIHKNDFIIVQQKWIKDSFIKFFNLKNNKVIISRPLDITYYNKLNSISDSSSKVFFYPAYPRPFKNFEVIIKAVRILINKGYKDFKVILTIDGTENKYSNRIVKSAKNFKQIYFTGFLDRESVYEYYSQADCLLFTSKLETWGLPLTEFKSYNKPIILSDLPYAKETLGIYNQAKFFNSDNELELSNLMSQIIKKKAISFSPTFKTIYENPTTTTWEQLFDLLLV